MTDSRQFAVDLMNRAGLSFDVPDVSLASGVVVQLEAELADWLEVEMSGVVVVADLIQKVRSGVWKVDGPDVGT